jgi:hypothetical protein
MGIMSDAQSLLEAVRRLEPSAIRDRLAELGREQAILKAVLRSVVRAERRQSARQQPREASRG